MTQSARHSQIKEALLSLELSWVHRARRPAGELLICRFTKVRQGTTGATAVEAHGKVPSGRPEGRALPRPIPLLYTTTWGEGVKSFTGK